MEPLLSVKVPSRWDLEEGEYRSKLTRSKRLGVVLHRALSMVRSLDDLEDAELLVREAMLLTGDYAWNAGKLARMLKRLLKVEGIEELFPKGEVFLEREFTDGAGKVVKPDRVTVCGNRVVVVDYKSRFFKEAVEDYVGQVREYCEVLEGVFGKKAVGFLLYIISPRIERVYP